MLTQFRKVTAGDEAAKIVKLMVQVVSKEARQYFTKLSLLPKGPIRIKPAVKGIQRIRCRADIYIKKQVQRLNLPWTLSPCSLEKVLFCTENRILGFPL
jgi:hypothetical protein